MGTEKNRLNKTVLLSTQNIYYELWLRKYLQFYADFFCLSKPMIYEVKINFHHMGLDVKKPDLVVCAPAKADQSLCYSLSGKLCLFVFLGLNKQSDLSGEAV